METKCKLGEKIRTIFLNLKTSLHVTFGQIGSKKKAKSNQYVNPLTKVNAHGLFCMNPCNGATWQCH